VRYGQGFLFSPPRPLRQNPVAGDAKAQEIKAGDTQPVAETAAAEPAA
jgi:hypothetical protein